MRRGFTLVELLLALALLSVLVVALVQLLETSLTIWARTEASRDLMEMGSSVVDLVADDLSSAEGGARGDLCAEWETFDTDKNQIQDALMHRVRLVRQASAAELRRLSPDGALKPRELGLIQVCWALLPSGARERDGRSVGILMRGERRVRDEDTDSFFEDDFFDARGRPRAGSMREVTGGVLWFNVWYAAQTSVVNDGWSLGEELDDCGSSWDAWTRGRPDVEKSYLNEPPAGMPEADEAAVLPRRVRIEIELERPIERKRRPRLSGGVDPQATSFRVSDDLRLPDVGTMMLVDEEWMELRAKGSGRATVLRGQRGTRATAHDAGALLHHGWRIVREVPIAQYREDWNL